MKRIPLILALAAVGIVILSGAIWTVARNKTYEEIISEKCWLNKQSRDIECITYIAK